VRPEPNQLFRREVNEARALYWVGEPVLPESIPVRVAAGICALIGLAICLFVGLGEYTRRVQVEGVLLPASGIAKIGAPATGWISRQYVEEGDAVQQGQPLYTLRVDNMTSHGSSQASVIFLLKQRRDALNADIARQGQLNVAKKSAIAERLRGLQLQLDQIRKQIEVGDANLQASKEMADDQKAAMKRGLATKLTYQPFLQAYLDQFARLEQLRQQEVKIGTEITDLKDQHLSFDLTADADLSTMRQRVIDVEQQIAEGEAKHEITVNAPREGIVTALIGRSGQSVTAGAPLLTVVPQAEPLEAQLFAPSSAIGFVKEGGRVLLRYDAYPYQKFGQFGGVVTRVTHTTLSAEEVERMGMREVEPSRRTALYRITVALDQTSARIGAQEASLQAGMTLQASILAEKRPIYQWLLEPLYAVTGSVASKGGRQDDPQ
jgi:membrane fusion protein